MIEVKDITKVYNKDSKDTVPFVALKGITFTIEDGEFVAIMGPSGSGKSTLMHILGCLDTPSTGTYLLDHKDVSSLDEDELSFIRREKIGFVFQSFNLLPRTSALRNVMLPLIYKGVGEKEREDRAKAALLAAGLDETYFNHLSNQLSGGQIQRVAIARSLVNDPTLILADEPTGNLDTRTGEIVLATFQELNRSQGKTIILITHERDVAEHADRIITIRDGVVVEDSRTHKKVEANVAKFDQSHAHYK